MRLLVLCALFAAALAADDVSGKWRGSINNGEMPAYLVLEQNDGQVTGSAGGSEKMLFKIRKGTMESDRLTIEASPGEGTTLRFALVVKGGKMEGEVEENGKSIGPG
jgi:hypothetical protein